MLNKYKLVGFLNLFNIVPDFVVPVFESKEKYYFQDGEQDRIKEFIEAKKSVTEHLIPLDCVVSNDIFVGKYYDSNSKPIYAFQTKDHVICGESSFLKQFFKTYTPSNEILETQIKEFLQELPPEYITFLPKVTTFYGTGRRKKSVARVRIMPGTGIITINKRDIDDYFGLETLKLIVNQPFGVTGTEGKYDIIANVNGGGISGQEGAIRHGLARALVAADVEHKPALKAAGFLTRDPRMKERKKYGLKAARRSPQFSKR